MGAIGRLLARGEYDVVLLSEVWMRKDHATISAAVQSNGLHITGYDELASGCDGDIGPWGCSGLAVVSR